MNQSIDLLMPGFYLQDRFSDIAFANSNYMEVGRYLILRKYSAYSKGYFTHLS